MSDGDRVWIGATLVAIGVGIRLAGWSLGAAAIGAGLGVLLVGLRRHYRR